MTVPKLSLRAVERGIRGALSYATLRRRRLPPALREAIVLHVSAVNECPICSSIHARIAAQLGVSPDEIAALRAGQGAPIGPRADVAIRYAADRTLGRADASVLAAFEAAFDPEEQREVRALVDLFTFNNAFNNTWEGILPGAARRRRGLRQ
jgi:AhpD family alkylhydroperoxidase